MERLTVVSTDGHGGPTYEAYRQYIDPKYRDLLEGLAEEERLVLNGVGMARKLNDSAAALALVDERGVFEEGLHIDLYSDLHKRLAQMDMEGIAGDFVVAGSEYALPFFHEINRHYPADVRAAGVRAFHRWQADFCGESGGRLFANGYSLPSTDMNEMLAELRFIVDTGVFKSVEVPRFVTDESQPPITSDFYEPYWAACADLGIVLNVHAGWGKEQGEVIEMLGAMAQMSEMDPNALGNMMTAMGKEEGDFVGDAFILDMGPRQVIWQLMLSGVFDRHPNLKVALVEIRADWLPETISYLDKAFAAHSPRIKLTPSEYFAQHFAITPSSPRPTEVALRHEIGLDNFMFGADMPHPEGTWPNTRTWLTRTFAGVAEDEIRKILGENAIRFYNLDRRPLDEVAARIGPTAAEITAGVEVDDIVLKHWNGRSGYLSPKNEVDPKQIEDLLVEDFAHAQNTDN